MKPQIGDKVRVKGKLFDRVCVIDYIDDSKIHFKNSNFGLSVNPDRVTYVSTSWKGAHFEYISFN
jgi:hypothetical protein